MSTTISNDELNPDMAFSGDLLLDNMFVVVPATAGVSEYVIKALKTWEFKECSYEGFICIGKDEEEQNEGIESEENLEANSAEEKNPEVEDEPVPEHHAIIKEAMDESSKIQSSSERLRYESVQKVYEEYMKYINSVYTYYATHKKINLREMTETVQKLCIFIKENKRFVLRISPSAEARSKNFLVVHSMRSTVLAITIAIELHYPLSKIVELGITSILHEIGMLRIPPQLYLTDKALTATEKRQISMHPILGCNILKELDFPNSILLGVLDHHEKENGLGYPRGIQGDKISPYGKIISVACSFEAISAPRPHKSERTTYDAMIEMLQNPNKQYDPNVIKALLYSLSLYPIGVYVYLNNGKIAIVSDVTPNKPQNPIVQLLNERESDGSPKTVQTDDGPNKIVRVLTKEEQADVVKNLKIQEKAEEEKQNARMTETAMESKILEQAVETEDSNGFSNVDLSEFS